MTEFSSRQFPIKTNINTNKLQQSMRKIKNTFNLRIFPLLNKTIFLRVDFNVPLKNNIISNNQKIKSSLETIKYLLKNNSKIILATHLGRPEGKIVPELSTKILLPELKKLLPKEKIIHLNDCFGKEIKEVITAAPQKTIFLLENLRFYKEEEKNDTLFAHSLAQLADIYINDAFAASHRSHASIEKITHFLPSLPGFSLEKEITELNKALTPKRPLIWIIGGAKLDKIDLLTQALEKADYILIGGALAFAFLKAKGIPVGSSKTDANSINQAKKILKKTVSKKIILPIDFVIAHSFSQTAKPTIVKYNEMQTDQIGLDLGPETIKIFKQYLRKAHTIVWNGPLGYFEWANYATATKEIGRFLGKLTATTICGGGETTEAMYKFHLEHELTHLSTGGGASLEFLSGKKLPGIIALEKNYKQYKNKIKTKLTSQL